METFWFVVIAGMLSIYVILDGFDLGAGIIHFLAGKDERERTLILRTIGPVWDGNEVWLIAVGGTLFFSFPALYAASFSGFYLPLMMVLWLLMLRGIGIELRGHLENPLWKQFWDFTFSVASTMLAIFFGAALGNVMRGVPLNSERIFFEPLWTNFKPYGQTGVLDWFTILIGLTALVGLAAHGANYVALKTDGVLQTRARHISKWTGRAFVILAAVSLVATIRVRPQMMDNYMTRIWGMLIPLIVAVSLAAMQYYRARNRDFRAFLSSAASIAGMLAGIAFGLYPTVLPSTLGQEYDLTVYNSAAQSYGLRVGVIWWTIGIVLATIYFTYLYRTFRGKVTLEGEGY
jgi:cytochrome d ubiquinol oxidase subunit II